MIKYNIISYDVASTTQKAFKIECIEDSITTRYNTISASRTSDDSITIISMVTGENLMPITLFSEVSVNGETFNNIDDLANAVDVAINFKRANSDGSGVGNETDPIYTTDKPNLATKSDLSTAIADAQLNNLSKEQVDAIVQAAIQNAEVEDHLATQTYVNSQGFIKSVSVDGTTITGDGTSDNPLVAHAVAFKSMTIAEVGQGLIDGYLTAGSMVYVSDGVNNYTGETGLYAVIKSDGTLDSYVLESEFQAHRQTDLARWQQVADMQTQIDDLQASFQNKTTTGQTPEDILSYAKTDAGYTVESMLGGVIDYTLISVLLSTGAIYVNGVKKISGDGLDLSIGSTNGTFVVNNGDVITCSSVGVSALTFTPYITA
jgi:hypothetical protein